MGAVTVTVSGHFSSDPTGADITKSFTSTDAFTEAKQFLTDSDVKYRESAERRYGLQKDLATQNAQGTVDPLKVEATRAAGEKKAADAAQAEADKAAADAEAAATRQAAIDAQVENGVPLDAATKAVDEGIANAATAKN